MDAYLVVLKERFSQSKLVKDAVRLGLQDAILKLSIPYEDIDIMNGSSAVMLQQIRTHSEQIIDHALEYVKTLKIPEGEALKFFLAVLDRDSKLEKFSRQIELVTKEFFTSQDTLAVFMDSQQEMAKKYWTHAEQYYQNNLHKP